MLTFMKKTILGRSILHKEVFDLIKINSQLNQLKTQLKKHLLIIKNTYTCTCIHVTGRI